jgi:ribosomal protein S18 acetylase RimI-like enzyme
MSDAPIRMRKILSADIPPPVWPVGTRRLPFALAEPRALHAILSEAYQSGFGSVPHFEDWWDTLNDDAEFDPTLVIIAADMDGGPIGLAQSWTSAFIKDIAVLPAWHGRGIGEALLLSTFHAFHERGATHVDLKVMPGNAAAIQLYRRLGMVEAPSDPAAA